MQDSRTHTAIGLVVAPGGESHFIIDGQDVLVDVELLPNGEQLLCRLGSIAGGAGFGVWAIPPVGTEVSVLIPHGDLEMDPVVIGTLTSGTAPAGLDASTLVIIPPPGGKVVIGDPNGQSAGDNGVVVGGGIDSCTGLSYSMLGNASSKVWAEKD